MKYYVVIVGKVPGIYTSWEEAKLQVHKYPKAIYKSFNNEEQAVNFFLKSTARPTDIIHENPLSNKTIIYTDGSFIDSLSGYGIVILMSNGDKYTAYGKVPLSKNNNTTNNIAELHAINVALSLMHDTRYTDLIIYSDSNYAISCLTTHIHDWMENGWKNTPNRDIIEETYAKMFEKNIEFYHVDAHKKIKYNEEADILADQGRLCKTDLVLYKNGEICIL